MIWRHWTGIITEDIMAERNVRILVLGAGAIGGVTAAFMKLKGYDVSILVRTDEDAETIRRQGGLILDGVRGDLRVSLPVYSRLEALDFVPDYLFHGTKATDLADSLPKLAAYIGPKTRVISMQNGICEDEFIRHFGAQRVVGCVTGWGSSFRGPGRYTVTSSGEFVIGAFHEEVETVLPKVKEMLEAAVPCYITANIRGALYSKLIINSAISSLGLISGISLGEMLKKIQYRRIFIAVMREAMAVAEAMGIRVEAYANKLDYYKFLDERRWYQPLLQHAVIRIIGFKYRRLRSSSLQSIKRGRKSEIPWLNGYICEQAGYYGIPVPVNTAITELVREIENGVSEPSVQNIRRIREIMK